MKPLKDFITIDSGIMFGKPVITGTRIPVELILEKLANGESVEQLLQSYPKIERESINACLMYAASIIKNETILSFS